MADVWAPYAAANNVILLLPQSKYAWDEGVYDLPNPVSGMSKGGAEFDLQFTNRGRVMKFMREMVR